MSIDRFEQDLPDLLAELAPRAIPDYRDDIVRQTTHMRQRPAWTFPERWLPMSAITTRAPAPPIRWRIVGLVALLLLTLAAGLAFVAGSQRHQPAPFGLADNGLVAYEVNGDIYTTDPVTGVAKAITTGPQLDLRPVFSSDGTHIVFERTNASTLPGRLMVARSDGSGAIEVTPDPIKLDPFPPSFAGYMFSPDGTEIALWSTPESGAKLWIAKADGSGVRPVKLPMNVIDVSYLPPDGAKLIVTGGTSGGTNGIYAIDAKTGSQVRTIVAPDPSFGIDYTRLSPDGSRLAYVAAATKLESPSSYRVHVVGIDGANDITLPLPPRAVFQDAPAWSNDGRSLAITRGYAQHNEDMAVAVVPADGSGVGVESTHGLTGCCDTGLQWSPDDRSILILPEELNDGIPKQQLLLDPSTAKFAPAPWTAKTPPTWQRASR